MGKNKGKGGKSFRAGKKDRGDSKRPLIYKEQFEEEAGTGDGPAPKVCYAVVTKCLGDCRVDVECDDGETRKGEIRGALRNKTFIRPGDFILVAVREYQPDRADVFHKYSPEDVAQLKKEKRLRPPLVEDDDMEDEDELGGAGGGGVGLFRRPAEDEDEGGKVDIDAI